MRFWRTSSAKGVLSLVLGAGASHGFSLPTWDELVDGLRDQGGVTDAKLPKPEEEADKVHRNHFGKDRLKFAEAVRAALYANVRREPAEMLKSDLLQAITAFLTSSLRGRGSAVITFNFDDLIETYFRLLGFIVRSETEVPAWASRSDMTVLHPHGLLPLNNNEAATEIIFTSKDFERVIGRERDEWNKAMSSVLVSTFPVFIGLSGTDARLQSLLSDVHERHPATKRDSSLYWGVRPTLESAEPHDIERWRDWRIAPRFFKSYKEIPSWILSICQKAAAAHS